jgi:hypothetical protein
VTFLHGIANRGVYATFEVIAELAENSSVLRFDAVSLDKAFAEF